MPLLVRRNILFVPTLATERLPDHACQVAVTRHQLPRRAWPDRSPGCKAVHPHKHQRSLSLHVYGLARAAVHGPNRAFDRCYLTTVLCLMFFTGRAVCMEGVVPKEATHGAFELDLRADECLPSHRYSLQERHYR